MTSQTKTSEPTPTTGAPPRDGTARAALLALAAALLGDPACSSHPMATGAGADASDGLAGGGDPGARFSFFVASLASLQKLSGNPSGFGGDLRFGRADGLSGADEICRQIAELSLPGAGQKTWRAFLSVTRGPDGNPVHAIDRVGEGPWYDRLGRLVAASKDDLAQTRPRGADPAIINDLPNEFGVPNHRPDPTMGQVDNHDILTGSDAQGRLYSTNWSATCHDWTSAVGNDGRPRVGHSWPRGAGGGGLDRPFPDGGTGPDDGGFGGRPGGPGPGGFGDGGPGFPGPGPGGFGDGGPGFPGGPAGGGIDNWMSSLDEAGCAAGINLVETGAPDPRNPTVGSGGGYGGIYCLALTR
jgi:hypothetical protein